jgi:Protein of unknown function (DUF3105)
MVEGGDHEARPRPLLGYAVSVGIVLAAVTAFLVLLWGTIGDDETSVPIGAGANRPAAAPEDVLPDGGAFPTPREGADLETAARAAGCELESFEVKSRDHIADLQAPVRYSSMPPTSGEHYAVPAADGAYEKSPYLKTIVHSLEHSRVVVWFHGDLPTEARGALKAFYDNDSALMLLVPNEHMTYEVAASAWNRAPKPNGTGRLLACPKYGDAVFTALQAFKERHRGKGPEQVP